MASKAKQGFAVNNNSEWYRNVPATNMKACHRCNSITSIRNEYGRCECGCLATSYGYHILIEDKYVAVIDTVSTFVFSRAPQHGRSLLSLNKILPSTITKDYIDKLLLLL